MNAIAKLDYLGAIRFAGPEAAKFLQGQLSHDTERLRAGAALLASYNSPQGRVMSVLTLMPHSSGVIGIVPRDLLLPIIESLRKYVLRAKVKIEDVSEFFAVAGARDRAALAQLNLAAPAEAHYVESGGIGVAPLGAHEERYWIIGERDALQSAGLNGARQAGAEQSWRLADIRAGRPQVYAATRELFVAQMLNLDLIDGISFSKGCYTGQEIIARTQHLGRIKRRMFRLGLPPGDWVVGNSLTLRDGRSGRIVEAAPSAQGAEVLAVLPLEQSSEANPPDESIEAQILTLPYSFDSAVE